MAAAATSGPAGEGSVVEIISIDRARGLAVDEDALRSILMDPSVAGLPVAVICVAGKFREGKSFLLNYFLNYLSAEEGQEWWKYFPTTGSGFIWKGGVHRVSTGISFWSKPFVRIVEGQKTAVLLVDTQGTFDNESTMGENVRVFSLGALLSSFLINNMKEKVAEDALQQLQLFVEFGKTTKDKGQGGLQTACFLVRDWTNAANYAPGLEGGKKYIDFVLNGDARHEELARVRKYIRDSFEDIHCFLLPSPGDNFLDSCGEGDARPDFSAIRAKFVDGIREFVPWVVQNVKIKRIGMGPLHCRDLCLFAIQCRNVFNSSEQPRVEGLYDAMSRVSHLSVKLTALKAYTDELDQLVSGGAYVKPQDLQGIHDGARDRALEAFRSAHKLGEGEFSALFLDDLEKDMGKKYKEVQELNTARRGARLTTPAVLVAVCIACNLVGTVFSLLGLSPLASLLSSVMWVSMVALLVWFYCNITGEFREFQEQLDGFVDMIIPHATRAVAAVPPLAAATEAVTRLASLGGAVSRAASASAGASGNAAKKNQ